MSSFQEFLQQLMDPAEQETGANSSRSNQSSDPTETTAEESLSSSYVMAENNDDEEDQRQRQRQRQRQQPQEFPPPPTILSSRGSSSSLGSMEHMMQDLHNSTDDVLGRVEALIQELRDTQIMDGLSSLEEDGGSESEYQPYQHLRHDHDHDDGGGSISSMSHFSSIQSNSVNNSVNNGNVNTNNNNNATIRPLSTLFLNSLSTTSSTYRPLDQPPGRTAIPENAPSSEVSSFSLRPSMLASSFTLLSSSIDRHNKNSHAPNNNHDGSSNSIASLSSCHTSNEMDDLILEGTDTVTPTTNHNRRTSFHTNHPNNNSTSSVIDPMAFSNIGSLLAAAAAGAAGNSTEGGWWSRFTDADWDELFATAKIVYQALEEERRKKKKNVDGTHHSSTPPPFSEWHLPPSEPLPSLDNGVTPEELQSIMSVTSSIAEEDNDTVNEDDTPKEFVCPQCHEILVGATLLVNCTCPHTTLCAPCVEHLYNTEKESSSSSIREHNYIWVDSRMIHRSSGWACSTCATHDTSLRTVTGEHGGWQWEPCPALDEAIQNAMSPSSSLSSSCQQGMASKRVLYYGRLREWHDRLVLRRSEALYEREHDMLVVLSALIAQEEEAFWNHNNKSKETRHNAISVRGRPTPTKWRLFEEAAALLAVPMVGTLLVRP
eukprot:scaffold44043_cov61-Attheya_sp.AAC.2